MTLAHFIEGVDQRVNIGRLETAAEIAGRGRIGNALSTQGVEIDFVPAAKFEVFQASAVAQGVVSEIEHVIGFVIGKMDLEQMQSVVDGVDQADASGQQVERTNAAMSDAAITLADLVADVGGGKVGPSRRLRPSFVETAFDSALASGQLFSYLGVHSKSLSSGGDVSLVTSSNTAES